MKTEIRRRHIFEPPPSSAVQVTCNLPSGQQVTFTFYNRQDAKYVYDALRGQAKVAKMPPPYMVAQ